MLYDDQTGSTIPADKATVGQAEAYADKADQEATFIKLCTVGLFEGGVIGDHVSDKDALSFRSKTEDLQPAAAPAGPSPDLASIIDALAQLQFRRTTYIREVNALNNRVRAMIRRALGWQWDMPEKEREALNKRAGKIQAAIEAGKDLSAEDAAAGGAMMADVIMFAKAREPLDKARHTVELDMRRIARRLPVWEAFGKGVRGFGELGLAVIVGEAGDISTYSNPAKLWKRLGLAVIDGERQQRKSDPELAAAHGYNPRRRAEMYAVIADPLFRGQWRGPQDDGTPAGPIGPYGAVYAREKAKALPRIEATKDLPAKDRWNGMRVERHARRLMTKALLLDLWRVSHGLSPRGSAPAESDPISPPTDRGREQPVMPPSTAHHRTTYEHLDGGAVIEAAEVRITFSFIPATDPTFDATGDAITPGWPAEAELIRAEVLVNGQRWSPAPTHIAAWSVGYLRDHTAALAAAALAETPGCCGGAQ